jgi:hypothetical protein
MKGASMFLPFLMISLLIFVSCGSDDNDNGNAGVPQQEEDQQQQGKYTVTLAPVNSRVSQGASGNGTFEIQDDVFHSQIDVSAAPLATHLQHIQVGSRCPGPQDDANGDGYIDAEEALIVSGGVIIPLDNDLSTQEGGSTYHHDDTYHHDEITSYRSMMQDLRVPDSDPNDHVVKLGSNESLHLDGKVVSVHGIPDSTSLPGTVRGSGDVNPHEGLPILCGTITRTNEGGTTGGTTGGHHSPDEHCEGDHCANSFRP